MRDKPTIFHISKSLVEFLSCPGQRNSGVTGSGGIVLTNVWAQAGLEVGTWLSVLPTFNEKDRRVLSGHKYIKVHDIFQKLKILGHFNICIETKAESEP